MIDHNIELHHIYRSLDLLAMHKEDIEQHLYCYKKDLFNLTTDVFYMTLLRFVLKASMKIMANYAALVIAKKCAMIVHK